MFLDGVVERAADLLQPVLQKIAHPDDHRRPDLALPQPLDHLVQIDLALGVALRHHEQMPLRVHAEIAIAPVADPVQLLRVLDRPRAPRGSLIRSHPRNLDLHRSEIRAARRRHRCHLLLCRASAAPRVRFSPLRAEPSNLCELNSRRAFLQTDGTFPPRCAPRTGLLHASKANTLFGKHIRALPALPPRHPTRAATKR